MRCKYTGCNAIVNLDGPLLDPRGPLRGNWPPPGSGTELSFEAFLTTMREKTAEANRPSRPQQDVIAETLNILANSPNTARPIAYCNVSGCPIYRACPTCALRRASTHPQPCCRRLSKRCRPLASATTTPARSPPPPPPQPSCAPPYKASDHLSLAWIGAARSSSTRRRASTSAASSAKCHSVSCASRLSRSTRAIAGTTRSRARSRQSRRCCR